MFRSLKLDLVFSNKRIRSSSERDNAFSFSRIDNSRWYMSRFVYSICCRRSSIWRLAFDSVGSTSTTWYTVELKSITFELFPVPRTLISKSSVSKSASSPIFFCDDSMDGIPFNDDADSDLSVELGRIRELPEDSSTLRPVKTSESSPRKPSWIIIVDEYEYVYDWYMGRKDCPKHKQIITCSILLEHSVYGIWCKIFNVHT